MNFRQVGAALLLLLTVGCQPHAAMRVVEGPARSIDGDTVVIGSVHLRLKGVDAPEQWMTGGPEATAAMRKIVGGWLTCTLTGEHTYHREVGFCINAAGQDIGAEIIRGGWALSYPHYSTRYLGLEQPQARRRQRRAPYC
jgi:endonuclease YncB( thermonuclease family)